MLNETAILTVTDGEDRLIYRFKLETESAHAKAEEYRSRGYYTNVKVL